MSAVHSGPSHHGGHNHGGSHSSARDYLSSVAAFESDSLPVRQDYEHAFLAHRRALAHVKPTLQTHNTEVFGGPGGTTGLRARLAANHAMNPPREARELAIARANAKLVEKLTEIAFKTKSATTSQILERNARVVHRVARGGSLNDHVRALEAARIEEANLGLAARLLSNKSRYAPENFTQHRKQHEYLVKHKSRLRAIQMKTSTPGQYLNGAHSPHRRRPGNVVASSERRNPEAETQAAEEYEGALRAYSWQQSRLGYGLPGGVLPPIPGSSDAELLGQAHQDAWLESHHADLQALKQLHTHAPKVRQSRGMNPREALHTPMPRAGQRAHYHHAHLPKDDARAAAAAVNEAFERLDSELVVPRTRLDPTTGAYEVEWIALAEARPEEAHLAQRRPELQMRAVELATKQQQDAAAQAYLRAMAAWQQQQQATAMYAAYVAHAQQHQAQQPQQAQQQAESKEAMPPTTTDAGTQADGFFSHPPLQHHGSASSIDGTPYAAPPWPFSGDILPPHLRPPPEAMNGLESLSPRQLKLLLARKQASTATASLAKGRTGRKIRNGPLAAATTVRSPHRASHQQTHSPSSKSTRSPRLARTQPLDATAASAAGPKFEVIDDLAATAAAAEEAPTISSHATAIPTIASSLGSGRQSLSRSGLPNDAFVSGEGTRGLTEYSSARTSIPGASGVPLPAFPQEFEGAHFMTTRSNPATAALSSATPRTDSKSPRRRPTGKVASPTAFTAVAASSKTKSPITKKRTTTAAKKSTIAPPPLVATSTASRSSLQHVPSADRLRANETHDDVKQPLVDENAPVAEKIDAFEQHATDSADADAAGADASIDANTPQRSEVEIEDESDQAEDRATLSSTSASTTAALTPQPPSGTAPPSKTHSRRTSLKTSDSSISLRKQPSTTSLQQSEAPELEITARYSNAHPFSVAHSSPSVANLHAAAAVPVPASTTITPSASTVNVSMTQGASDAAPAAVARPTTAEVLEADLADLDGMAADLADP